MIQFSIPNNILLNKLNIVKNVINNNHTIPILNNICINIKNNKLYLIGSDLETSIIIKLNIDEQHQENNIITPINIILNMLKTLPKKELLILNIENNNLNIILHEGKYVISSKYNPKNYPYISKIKNYSIININKQILYNALSYTLFTVNNDEIKPSMNGVFFKIKNTKITCVATNAKRLVKYSNNVQNINNSEIKCIIPKKPLLILKSILSTNKIDDIKLYYNKINITFIIDDIMISCKPIEGMYPNYNTVIPINNEIKISLNRIKLLTIIKRISLFTDSIQNKIQFNVIDKKIIITTNNNTTPHQAYEYIKHNHTIKKQIIINFNAKSIIELLSNIPNDEIILELYDYKTVGVFKVKESISKSMENVVMLIMPVI